MMRNLYVFLIFAVFFTPALFAGQVTKVKGENALIELGGEAAQPGDMFYTLGTDGKHHGIIQISKVKGDKAIAHIAKGKVEAGMSLERRNAPAGGAGGTPKQAKRHKTTEQSVSGNSRSYWGGMVGYAMDSMSVTVMGGSAATASQTIGKPTLTGTSFSAMAFFDYELFPQIWFRGLGGLEGFNVTGSSICTGTSATPNKDACNASIYYLSGDFLGRYLFSMGTFRPWLGGGIGLMFPMTKSATALNTSSISNTNVMQVAGGFDWFISPTAYIPMSIEYGLLPKSNDVDATWMEFRIGFAVPF